MSDEPESGSEQEVTAEAVLFDAGDPKAVATSKKAAELRERESARFWDAVFGSAVGRREMWKLLDQLGAFKNEFACGPNGFPQPEATWFKQGQSSFGRDKHQEWLVKHTDGVVAMHRENDSRFVKKDK